MVTLQSASGRVRRFFRQKRQAEAWMVERIDEEREFGRVFATMGARERLYIAESLDKLRAAGATLQHAVEFFLLHKPHVAPPTLAEACSQCLEAKRLANQRPRTLSSLASTLSRFSRGHPNLLPSQVTPAMIQTWLSAHAWKPATQRSYLTDLRTFFAWAKGRYYVVSNPAEAIPKPILDDVAPGILTVDQARALLEATRKHEPTLLAGVAIALFAGLRPAEIAQLEWSEVGKTYIEVTAAKAKSRRRRLVKIEPALRAWLKLGGVLPPRNWKKRFAHVLEAAKITAWPHDAMRHSFASYHLAKGRSADRTAHELGHSSTQMLFAHYRELVTHAAGVAWFRTMPGKG